MPARRAAPAARGPPGARAQWMKAQNVIRTGRVEWDMGATEIVASFQFLSATQPNQGRVVITPKMLNLQWEQVSLYPAGYYTRQIPVQATVTYPAGWQAATALAWRQSPPSRCSSSFSSCSSSFKCAIRVRNLL